MADINSSLPVNDTADGSTGSAVPTIATQVGGTDGTNLRALSLDTTGKLNVNNISGTISLPTGAATAANQTNASQKTQIVDGSGNVISSTTNSLNVNVTNSFAVGIADKATFTYGTSIVNAIGGAFQDTSPTLTAGQSGVVRLTSFRGMHHNLRDNSGNEIGISGNPLRVDPTGTTPQPASQSGTWTVQQGATPTAVANAWPIKLTDGTNTTAVKAASTAAGAGDPSAVVALSPNSPIPTGANTIGSISNISGTISLPTGAATSALQTTGNTSLSTIATALTLAQGSSTSGQTGSLTLASVTTGAPTYATGTTSPLSLTTSGALRVDSSNSSTVVIEQYNQQIINGNAFSAIIPVNTVNINSTETNVYYIKNNGSKTVYIFSIEAIQDPSNGNSWARFFIYYNPTVTVNGTTVTPSNLLAGSATASSANSYYTPTTSSRGSLVDTIYQGFNNANAPVQQKGVYHFYILPPSQSLLISGIAKANGNAVDVAVQYFEV